MIALLTGTLVSKAPERIILDVNGVGYQVAIPLSSFYSLPDEGVTTLHIYTHVREDSLTLFGFLSIAEKEMFILLLSITGIGPKVALNILSHMSCSDLHTALINEDINHLATLPGIGKKTAERLILELRDKVRKLSTSSELSATTQATAASSNKSDDALSALINLGYKEKQAGAAIAKVDLETNTSMEAILKAALKHLSR
ncbi:MAG: Holliday junction branch migration protein RuvA [Desulfuromonas sp.]|nr:Holliday junction branch migration protein RuvA [Desulfuromonas sp.]